jgi:hypothetical protein
MPTHLFIMAFVRAVALKAMAPQLDKHYFLSATQER